MERNIKQMTSKKLRKLLLGVLFLTGILAPYNAFSQETCGEKLKKAEELYEAGQINKVAGLIEGCLQNGFSRAEKVRAYRLLALCNLYYNEDVQAIEAMNNLLKTNPEYVIKPTDPAEFVNLHRTFRTAPVFIVGLKLGMGYFNLYDLKNYNDIQSMAPDGTYQPNNSYSLGVSMEIPVYRALSVGAEWFFSQRAYDYEHTVMDYANVSMSEDIKTIDMPVFLQWNFRQKDFTPYLNLGVSFSYLLGAQVEYKRTDIDGKSYREPLISEIDLSNSRNSFNYALSAGAGFRWKNVLGRGYLCFDIRYSRNLKNHVEAAARADDQEAVYSYFTTDNTFKFEDMQLMLGYKLPIYFPKYRNK